MKKCIFYLPYKLDEHGMGARMLRPRKMIQAFRDIGYEVYVIEGYSTARRQQIKDIKRRIEGGERYDFMYTESHTEPTLLTNPNHLPTHPFLDFGFFNYVRKKGIKIGLFYCDIYWKFDSYGRELPAWKRRGALLAYGLDIQQYKKHLSRFYVPDLKLCSYLNEAKLSGMAAELPPGADNLIVESKKYDQRDFSQEPLTVFYVGGLGNQYQIAQLVKAVQQTENTRLILCCREAEWEKEKLNLQPYICQRVQIVHKNADELEPFYQQADICSLLFKKDIYREMAKPFKAYEYLAHEIPVLSTKGTAIGDFVEKNDIGWSISFDADEISKTLQEIIKNPACLVKKIDNCRETKTTNLWTSRAEQVVKDLVK